MSRSYCSYDEEWQRRKSVLIRSLFHDIPILSPVEEESNNSSHDYHAPIQEVLPSPPRPYSPLPPLIIERVPVTNKHDEPEEYYTKFEKKIKKIYVRLFIEKRNLSDIEHDSTSNVSSVNDDNLINNNGSDSVENVDLRFLESISPGNRNFDSIIEDREARQSSASTKSNGYGADFESMDTAIVDVLNYTTSNENVIMLSEEEDADKRRNKESDNWKSSEDKKTSRERTDDRVSSEEQNSKHSTIEDQEMTESGESSESEDEQSYEEEESTNEDIDEHETTEETNESGESDRVRTHDPEFNVDESRHSRINDQELTDRKESSESENEQKTENKTKNDSGSRDAEPKAKGSEKTASGGDGDADTSSSSDGPDYRQITTEALVHVDGSQDTEDRESRVYEESVKSVILPTRFPRVVGRNVFDRMKMEEKEDPKPVSTFDTDVGEPTEDDFEEVRSPLPDRFGENIGAMGTSTPETTEKELEDKRTSDVEAMRSHKQKSTAMDLEEIETYHSDATNANMRTHQLEAFDKEIVAMRTSTLDITEKEIVERRTPRLDNPDEDYEAMRSQKHKSTEMDLEEETRPSDDADMRTHHQDVIKKKIVAIRTYESETNEEEDGKGNDEEVDFTFHCPVEQMRTPGPDLSKRTIPVTHQSDPESANEHTALSQEATMMTSSSQNGAKQNISDLQTSNEMNDILASLFNESRSKDGTTVSGRKRKLVDKSVQAVPAKRLTWEEMRANFFVGTPKIFRLCACTDHVCN